MTLHLSIVADVFTNEAQAKHALEALRQAGFGYDQIGVAMHGHEGIDLQSDLENLGVSPEQASYYVQEVKAGHTVISVRPDGREREAHEIMRRSGAFTDSDSGTSEATRLAKQQAAWDQAIASHQAYLAAQLAANNQEDFHQPRSLRPREQRQAMASQQVQPEETTLFTQQRPASATMQQEDTTEKKAPAASIVQQEETDTTEQLPVLAIVQPEDVSEQEPLVAEFVQIDVVDEQLPLAEEGQPEMVDDEDTLRRLRPNVQENAEASSPQTQLGQPKNKNLVKNGALLGGVLLGLGAGVVVALLQRERIQRFILSILQTGKKARS